MIAKSSWRGKHKASKCLIFIVLSGSVKSKELNYTQTRFGKIKLESSFRQMCLFPVYFIDLYEEEEVTPLSEKWKLEELIITCGNGDESDDNELVDSKKEATTNKFQARRDILIIVWVSLMEGITRRLSFSLTFCTVGLEPCS